jgi:hypothetical protein
MALPRPTRPEYSTTIPSTGKKIKYQPFTVREEKILVLAAESQDSDEITNAVTNCIKNCVTSPADININELALFDIEYLFLKCRAKSVGEKLTVRITDPMDETFIKDHEINIDKIQVIRDKSHTDLIDIEGIFVKMSYPDITFFTQGIDLNSIESNIEMISRCIRSITQDEEVYARDDMEEGELLEWLEGLSKEQFTKITEFFVTMPKLSHTIKIRNTNTDKDFEITLEGLSDFF